MKSRPVPPWADTGPASIVLSAERLFGALKAYDDLLAKEDEKQPGTAEANELRLRRGLLRDITCIIKDAFDLNNDPHHFKLRRMSASTKELVGNQRPAFVEETDERRSDLAERVERLKTAVPVPKVVGPPCDAMVYREHRGGSALCHWRAVGVSQELNLCAIHMRTGYTHAKFEKSVLAAKGKQL